MKPLHLPPLSLYIHIPWCVKKCPYCDFNSHTKKQEIPEDAYIETLLEDLRRDQHFAQGRSIQTIFIGGGTPSLFKAKSIQKIIKGVEDIIPIAHDAEITMEANPGTMEHEGFEQYRRAGVTRLSLGIQSFSSEKLNLLGRIHDDNEALRAAENVAMSQFKSFNLDLMHGLPHQSYEQAMYDLDQACALDPEHISWYQLTIEPNTLFHKNPPKLPHDDDLWKIFDDGRKKLQALGYHQYEISGYAKKNYQCQHNLNYWRFGDYLGIGCGAHGKITNLEEQSIFRTEKIKHPKGYLAKQDKMFKMNSIEQHDIPLEYFMNRARLLESIPKKEFEDFTGHESSFIDKKLEQAFQKELLISTDEHWQVTDKGMLFLNDILGMLQ